MDADNPRMDLTDYLRTVFALLFVLGLIGILYFLARHYGAQRFGLGMPRGSVGRRLAIMEVRMIDARRRLVLVRRDDVEHLLLLGPDKDVVVESGIPARTSFESTLAHTDDREAAQ